MYLLIHISDIKATSLYVHLHSIMYLLIHIKEIPEKINESLFTFHNVSINSNNIAFLSHVFHIYIP